jgi:hypothetical protein
MLNANPGAGEPRQGPPGLLCFDELRLGGPEFLDFVGIPFHEDCGQPFYLLCFGLAFLADLLQPLLVMLKLQSAAKSPEENFLGGI